MQYEYRFLTHCRHKDIINPPKNQAIKKKGGNKMLPPKKHLKPIFCHENNLFVKDDFETEHPATGHKKKGEP